MENLDEAVKNIVLLFDNLDYEDADMFKGYKPVYPFNTDDQASVFDIHADYIKDSKVLTVTGSGDSILDLFLNGATKVVAFDSNKAAKYLAILKFAAIKAGLSFDEFVNFFYAKGYDSKIFNYETYKKISPYLDLNTRYVWDKIYVEINKGNISFNPRKTSFIYAQFDNFFGFRTNNLEYKNTYGYLHEDNYEKISLLLKTKTLDDISFIDVPLFSLDDYLENKDFSFVYLSNIIDFTSYFINKKSLEERLKVFKNFIINTASNWVIEDGIIIVGFINHYHNLSSDIYYAYKDYLPIFNEDDDFYLLDLLPNNLKDVVIAKSNKKIEKKLVYID